MLEARVIFLGDNIGILRFAHMAGSLGELLYYCFFYLLYIMTEITNVSLFNFVYTNVIMSIFFLLFQQIGAQSFGALE